MGKDVVKLFSSSPLAKSDPLWLRVMSLLVFRAPYVGVLSDDVLAHVTAPGSFLPAIVLYSLFGANNANTAPLESQIRFLSDQVTTYHFTNLIKMTESRDMESLDAYMTAPLSSLPLVKPINNYTVSDFPILVKFIAPIICDDLARAPLSLCQLEIFNDGLQSVLRFERQRRSNMVELEDVLEVDVRKKLDVIDQEKKQYEIMSTLMTVANKIGSTIKSEMTATKTLLSESTALIRKDIEATRVELGNAIGSVGREIQSAIAQNTAELSNKIGQETAAIRQDIADSSRQLAQRLDQTGQAILGAVEQSKQELKYQIGAEAEKTRGVIVAKADELKTHITNEVTGVREFVDAKTKQIIGVVQDEGLRTRVFMDQKANQVIGVVREEGEKTRGVVREESRAIQKHIDVKTAEIVGVVKEEGDKTRAVVVEKAAALAGHITNEATDVKNKIGDAKDKIMTQAASQYDKLLNQTKTTKDKVNANAAAMLQLFKNGTAQLAGIHLAACVRTSTQQSEFNEKHTIYLKAVAAIGDSINDQKDNIKVLDKDIGSLPRQYQYGHIPEAVEETTRAIKAIAGGDIGAAKSALASASSAMNYIKPAGNDEGGFVKSAQQLSATISQASQAVGILEGTSSVDPAAWASMKRLMSESATLDDVDAVIKEYNNFKKPMSQAQLSDLGGGLVTSMNFYCDGMNSLEWNEWDESGAGRTPGTCTSLSGTLSDFASRFSAALTSLDGLQDMVAQYAANRMECLTANKVINDASSRRRLTELPENEPYYAMSYSALTKIILDYQLQEAAFQFCKFYEFRNGGVAPTVCGTGLRTYYTLPQILQMRSYNPPTYNSVAARAYLPTKPTFNYEYNRSYPYVDLARLRAGKPVYFTLPTWDLDWLKKYSWISPALTAEKVPSIYVESIRMYLPVQTNSSLGKPSTSSVTATVSIESDENQIVSLSSRDRQFKLPKQIYKFGAVYGATSCPTTNKMVNPYDTMAGCVQVDATSDVCVREKGTTDVQNEKQLLPGLFSTWRASGDFAVSPAGALDVLVPKAHFNSTGGPNTGKPVGELLVIVDLTLIQVTAAKSAVASVSESENESERKEMTAKEAATATCCAADEYRVAKNLCEKCTPGTIGVLHGYACVPI